MVKGRDDVFMILVGNKCDLILGIDKYLKSYVIVLSFLWGKNCVLVEMLVKFDVNVSGVFMVLMV